MRIAEVRDDNNGIEFYFVGLKHWNDFEIINQLIISNFHFKELQKLDGIAIRKRVFGNGVFKFTLMHDDHVGNYVYCQEQNDNEKLRFLAKQVLELITK